MRIKDIMLFSSDFPFPWPVIRLFFDPLLGKARFATAGKTKDAS
jgi:hypothetical protein